jgi:uncharacterized peroxidase-related enzyme
MTGETNICWIDTVGYADADNELKQIYDKVRNPDSTLDNLYQAFSLRAHTIIPADDLYRAALHNDGNTLPKWFAELIGSYVAMLSGCDYAFTHHSHNFVHLFGDKEKAQTLLQALREGHYDVFAEQKQIAALRYVARLTLHPGQMKATHIDVLRRSGWDDGDILEIAQVVGMFSYFVRIINATGISLTGDKIGLY